jgi:hypothetical protein
VRTLVLVAVLSLASADLRAATDSSAGLPPVHNAPSAKGANLPPTIPDITLSEAELRSIEKTLTTSETERWWRSERTALLLDTVPAVSCSAADVNTAIEEAVSGDTVSLPGPCSANWGATTVAIPDTKGITLNGNGAAITTTSGRLTVAQHATVSTRITDFAFSSTTKYVNGPIRFTGSPSSAPFRLDHTSVTSTVGGTNLVEVYSLSPGLIDNNDFSAPTNSEMVRNYGAGTGDASGWSVDVTPGSADALYIEDNTFTNNDPDLLTANPAYYFGNSALQSYYGARTVFRYNVLFMSQVDQHGTPGSVGARWWEIYENEFQVVLNGNQSSYGDLRAGSGVAFNNRTTGSPNLGAGNLSLREEDTGAYPELYQIGRGKNQVLDPAYVWDNSASMTIAPDGGKVVENRDVYQSARPGYTPYTYPHPLNTDEGDPEPAVTGTGRGRTRRGGND